MCGEIHFGTCDICKKRTVVESEFYHYGFKCDCHSPEHFERVNYCKDCAPHRPPITRVTMTDEQAQFIAEAVKYYKKNKVKHGHWVLIEPKNRFARATFKCSLCGQVMHRKSRFCPECGAAMVEDCDAKV